MRNKILFIGLSLVVILSIVILPYASQSQAAPSITIALGGPPITTLDPTVMGGGGNQAGFNVFESLIKFNADNKMVPCLAESWQVAPDGKSITVKLKKGVKYSTGDPLTTADVKWSMERYAKHPGPVAAQLTQNFSGMEIIDDLTCKFVFPAVNVQFLSQTLPGMFVLSKTQYEKLGEDKWVRAVAGTGPYKFVEYKDGQYAKLAYNELYHGKKPQITDVTFLYTPDPATRISQLRAGEVDMINDVHPSSIAQVEKEGYTRYDVIMPHAICLQIPYMNKDFPWAKLEVRQAMNYAIDKELLNEKLFGSLFKEARWQMEWEMGYDPSLDPSYPYDMEKAKQLMAKAGYANGFEMPLYFPAFLSWGKDMVDYLTGTFAQLGIKVKPIALSDFGAFMSTVNKFHKDPTLEGIVLFDVGWPGNPEPVINLTNGFYSVKDNTLFKDPELDAIIKKALETPDDAARIKLVQQAYNKINDEIPFIPILLEVTAYAYKNNITFKPSTGGMNWGPANVFDLTIN